MAGQRELKKRLNSVKTAGQLAGAMRTVSAAKFSRVDSLKKNYAAYSEACLNMARLFGSELTSSIVCGDREAPPCYVVIAGNRGLCGAYNIELCDFAERTLKALDGRFRLVTIGRMAEAAMREAELTVSDTFTLPDVPSHDDAMKLLSYLRNGYTDGKHSSVHIIYQKFYNMLTQRPDCTQVLPLTGDGSAEGKAADDDSSPLFIPDRATVLKNAAQALLDSRVYSILLEAASGSQAATLMAMRTAYDNAEESTAELESELSRRRQSAVTAGVLETAADNSAIDELKGK